MKYIVLATIFVASLSSFAQVCRCNSAQAVKIKKNLLSAKTALVGEVVPGKSGQQFRIHRAWSTFQSAFALEKSSLCSLDLQPNKLYLFVSSLSIETLNKPGMGPTICDSYAVEFPAAKSLVSKLASYKSPNITSPNPTLQSCADDDECLLVSSFCGGNIAVNKNSAGKAESWIRKISRRLKCQSAQKFSTKVTCENYFCTPIK